MVRATKTKAGDRTDTVEGMNDDTVNGAFTENALRVLQNRYLRKDGEGVVVETPIELFQRVADHVAGVEDDAAAWSERYRARPTAQDELIF